MLTQFVTIGILMLLAAMIPGPDFALVTKNTIVHSRRAGLFTSLGIGSSNLIHMTYCMLGLGIVISQSLILFNTIKYIGATYLIYLGIMLLLPTTDQALEPASEHTQQATKSRTTDFKAFKQGFLCNLLNPKATLFFLALFTVIIPGSIGIWGIAYACEMFLIITAWFCLLTLILSHPRILKLLNKVEKYISKALGVFLIGFGVSLAFFNK